MPDFWSSFLAQVLAGAILLLLGTYLVPSAVKKYFSQNHIGSGDNVGGNKNVYYVDPNLAEGVQKVPKRRTVSHENIGVDLKDKIGIVKSPDFLGTRLHVGVVVTNSGTTPIVLERIVAEINSKELFFKQFFLFKDIGFRVPDMNMQLPLIIPTQGRELFFEVELTGEQILTQNNSGWIALYFKDDLVIKSKVSFFYNTNAELNFSRLPKNAGALVIETLLTTENS